MTDMKMDSAVAPPSLFRSPHRLIVGLVYLILFILSLILFNLIVCILSPLYLIKPRWVYDINSQLAKWIWEGLQYLFIDLHHADVSFSGDYHDIPREENAFIICNHLSWSDFYMIHALAQRKSMLGRCRYFAKHSLRYIPVFGWAVVLIGMVIVKRDWANDRAELERTFASMKERKWPVCMSHRNVTDTGLTMFVEGTRFRPVTRAASQAYSKKAGLPVFENVLVPRHKGFNAAITGLRGSHIRHVYDLTIAYYPMDKSPPSPLGTFCFKMSPYYKFHVHIRRYDIDDLPHETEASTQWLIDRWVEKDKILGALKNDWQETIRSL